jgi:hypothetical protein
MDIDWNNLQEETILFSKGTKLEEVPPEFRGISYDQWRMLNLTEQAEDYRRSPQPVPEVAKRAISTTRDDYGVKGNRGSQRKVSQRAKAATPPTSSTLDIGTS